MVGKALLTLTLLGVPTGIPAQDSIRLRFAPVFDVQIHRVFQTHTRMTAHVSGGTSGAAGIRVTETANVGGITQTALRGPGGQPVVHVAFDSLRTLMRNESEPWREYGLSGTDTPWIQVRLDEQMRVLEMHASSDRPGAGMLVRSLTGVPTLLLPDRWVQAGDMWTVVLNVPLRESMGPGPIGAVAGAGAGAPTAILTSQARVVIDSVITRTHDTLAYLAVWGAFAPSTLTLADGTALEVNGGLTSADVWSTGWRAYVSAATRIEVHIAEAGGQQAGERAADVVTLETTIREQVRP